MSEFAEFTRAVASRSRADAPPKVLAYSRVAVLGGDHDARLIAALCLAAEAEVTLFSAYGEELDTLRTASGIGIRGDGPVGSYQIDRDGAASIQTTAELDRAVANAEVIFLTGPVHKQRTYAMVLANHLHDGQVLVLAPGRSLGALETSWFLRIGGCRADMTIVEIQGLPYWYSAQGTVLTLSQAAGVAAASLPSGRTDVIAAIERFLPGATAVDSVLASGFADGSSLVEFPALMLAGAAFDNGGPAIPQGGVALPENHTFAALLGSEQRTVAYALADERRDTARAFGVRNLPENDLWIEQYAGAIKGEGARPVPDAATAKALLRDGIIGSLVPLMSAAAIAGTAVPVTHAMVTLASSILDADIAAAGRRLETVGITGTDIDSVRRAMDAVATGAAH